jgi:hypothetical protein
MMAHHERHKDRTGRLGLRGDIRRNRDGHRGNTSSLKSALHERD